MDRIEIKVAGMTCDGCVSSIETALSGRLGVRSASADLESGVVTIDFDPEHIQPPSIAETIEDAGFDVV